MGGAETARASWVWITFAAIDETIEQELRKAEVTVPGPLLLLFCAQASFVSSALGSGVRTSRPIFWQPSTRPRLALH